MKKGRRTIIKKILPTIRYEKEWLCSNVHGLFHLVYHNIIKLRGYFTVAILLIATILLGWLEDGQTDRCVGSCIKGVPCYTKSLLKKVNEQLKDVWGWTTFFTMIYLKVIIWKWIIYYKYSIHMKFKSSIIIINLFNKTNKTNKTKWLIVIIWS